MMAPALFVVLVLASTQSSDGGGSPGPPQAPGFDTTGLSAYVGSFVGRGRLPSVAVTVVGRDGSRYQMGFGRIIDSGEPVTAAAKFPVGALAGAVTTLAILQLADSGRIALDERVALYLPDLAFRSAERARRMTVRHLMMHTSGLSAMSAFNRRVRLERRLDHIDLPHEPGTRQQISPINDMILEAVLEAVTGQRYADWVAEHVFAPLGMRSTTAHGTAVVVAAVVADAPRGHRYVFGLPVPTGNSGALRGPAATTMLVSSAEDIGRFLSLFLNGGRLGDREILSADGVAVMLETPSLARSEGRAGFHAVLGALPDEGYGVVVLANRSGGPLMSAPDALMEGILARLSGRESAPYMPWERLLHVGLLIVVGVTGLLALHWRRRWRALGGPRAMAHTAPVISRFVLDLTLGAAMPIIFLLGVVQMPIQAVLSAHPDWGLATILFPTLLVPTAVWRSLVRSEEWRIHG
jgi:CubicO group peptidase (beta-lactamase class C family)